MKRKPSVIVAFSPEAVLKRKVRTHLSKLGFHKSADGSLLPPSSSKETVRELHSDQRKNVLKAQRDFVRNAYPKLKHYFAEGKDIDPEKIAPALELIDADTWQSDLFRLASLSWSVPVSRGFGRRLRYLVWDTSNKKLMGIIALGDPVFNLKARDDLIGWNVADRGKRFFGLNASCLNKDLVSEPLNIGESNTASSLRKPSRSPGFSWCENIIVFQRLSISRGNVLCSTIGRKIACAARRQSR